MFHVCGFTRYVGNHGETENSWRALMTPQEVFIEYLSNPLFEQVDSGTLVGSWVVLDTTVFHTVVIEERAVSCW